MVAQVVPGTLADLCTNKYERTSECASGRWLGNIPKTLEDH